MALPRTFPEPDLFTPDSAPSLRWGIAGPGRIASAFVSACKGHTRQQFTVVGSRSLERAAAFAQRYELNGAVGSYEELVARNDVDVVYIATPQSEHLALGHRAIQAGKHVLIEKPLATNADDALTLTNAAQAAGVFLMEAMWTRYLPQSDVIRQLIRDGVLGDVEFVIADHGQAIVRDGTSRLWKPELGGGVLGDIGIYPIALSSEVLGTPVEIMARGGITSTGVEANASIVLVHANGALASVSVSLLTSTPIAATIAGSAARIEIAPPFFTPKGFTLSDPQVFDGEVREWTDQTGPTRTEGLSWEATALARYVSEQRQQSPLHTHAETVAILRTIDEARRQLLTTAGECHGPRPTAITKTEVGSGCAPVRRP